MLKNKILKRILLIIILFVIFRLGFINNHSNYSIYSYYAYIDNEYQIIVAELGYEANTSTYENKDKKTFNTEALKWQISKFYSIYFILLLIIIIQVYLKHFKRLLSHKRKIKEAITMVFNYGKYKDIHFIF